MKNNIKQINDNEIIQKLNNCTSYNDCLRQLNCYQSSGNINYLKIIVEKYNIDLQFKQKYFKIKKINCQKVNCQFCNNLYSIQGIKYHERYCHMNPNREIHHGNNGATKGHIAWNKGLTIKTSDSVKQQSITIRQNYMSGKNIPYNLGTHHTEDHKYKQRLGAIEYLKKNKGFHNPRFNKNSGEYIEKLNKENNWNLQYYGNGGECEILGYFLDGYDKEKNIVFEYDEPKHYKDVYNNILSDKDIIRQNNIINKLHCQFWRYNERLDKLYQVM